MIGKLIVSVHVESVHSLSSASSHFNSGTLFCSALCVGSEIIRVSV